MNSKLLFLSSLFLFGIGCSEKDMDVISSDPNDVFLTKHMEYLPKEDFFSADDIVAKIKSLNKGEPLNVLNVELVKKESEKTSYYIQYLVKNSI